MTYEEVLEKFAATDDRLIVMTAENRAAIRNLPAKIGKRFIDVGIAEQTMIGAAAGLALRGRIPVVHALATFLTLRAFEFVRTDVGIGHLPVKLVGGVPGFLSDGNGPTHQAVEDIALMRGIPNMQVFAPRDEYQLTSALPVLLDSPEPCYIRYYAGKPLAESRQGFQIGKAEILREGKDATILTYGFLANESLKATEILAEKGYSVGVVDMRMLAPVDREVILRVAKESPFVFTIEDHFQTGGLYTIVSEVLLENRITANVIPFALNARWFRPALLQDVLEYEGFSAQKIAGRIENEILAHRKN
jgi:transketolase